MTGRLETLPGPPFIGSMATITNDAVDDIARDMPGLRFYVDPARLSARVGGGIIGRERGGGARVLSTKASQTLSAAQSGMNGQMAIVSAAIDGDLAIIAPPVTASFTFVGVIMVHDDVLNGANIAYLLSVWRGSAGFGYEQRCTFNPSVTDVFQLNAEPNTVGAAFNANLSGFPLASGLPAVFGFSFDNTPSPGSKTGEIWCNVVDVPEATASNLTAGPNLPTDPNSYTNLLGARFISTGGVKGNAGRMFYFDQAYHTSAALRAQMADLFAALRVQYAIT